MLDAEFYTSYYEDIGPKNTEDAVRHWNQYGKAEGRFENPHVALERLQLDPRLPADFEIASYLELNPDVAASLRWSFEAPLHYLEYGRREGRQYRPMTILSGTPWKKPGARHPETAHAADERDGLPAAFNAGSYLANNPDIRAVRKTATGAIDHYLNYGLAEERACAPHRYSPRFIEQLYQLAVPQGLPRNELPAFVRREKGFSHRELLYFYEDELLRFFDITLPYLSQVFDHAFYAERYLGGSEQGRNRAQCLVHFCEIGCHQEHAVAPGFLLDVGFYQAEYGIDPRSERTAYQDWMRSDVERVRWPNLSALLKGTFDVDVPAHLLASAVERARGPGSERKPSQYATRFIEDPLLHPIVHEPARAEMARFHADLGDRQVRRKNDPAAAGLYDAVLAQVPDFARVLANRAEVARRLGDIDGAIALHRRLIDLNAARAATYADLAACHLQRDDRRNAIRALEDGARRFPGDAGLRRQRKACATAHFEALWQDVAGIALSYGYPTAQALVREAAELCTETGEMPPVAREIVTVAIYANCDLPQCKFYRVDQRAEQLAAAGYRVKVYDYVTETERYIAELSEIDLTIVYRVPGFPYVIDAIQKTTALGIVTLYDVDDLVFDETHFPPPLQSYAGQIGETDHAAMACGVSLFAHAMTLCQYGMVSTRSLIPFAQAKVATGKVFLHPNGLGREHGIAREAAIRRLPGKTTIFYGSGTKAHKADFTDIVEPALLRLFEAHGDRIHVIVVGDLILSPTLSVWRDAITLYKPVRDLQTYWDLLKLSDINLSVLEKSVFNDCKSEIKWLEAAAFGIPSVVSASATHEDVIVPGETGYLYANADELFTHLDALVRSPGRRQQIGHDAAKRADARYALDVLSRKLASIIKTASAPSRRAVKRLTIVNVFYPPQSVGGATRVVHDNVLDLKRILGPDWQIDVICTREGGLTPYEVDWYVRDGIRVFCITAAIDPRIDHITEDPGMARAFGRVMETIRPDLVHFHCMQRLTASCLGEARRRGVPFAVTMHDGWWISPNQFLLDPDDAVRTYDFTAIIPPASMTAEDFERSRILKRHLAGAERLLTVSKSFAALCRRTGLESVTVIENGVSRLPALPERRPTEGRVRLAFIGGLAAHKGYTLIRNIFLTERFANVSLLLIDHAMQPGLTVAEVWQGTPVEIRGKTPQGQIADLYESFDILLAPSVWPESFGLVTREALAMGRWVVASDRGAIGECVVEGENGYVVDVSGPAALLGVLKAIDADPDRHRRAPDSRPTIRTAERQAEDLAALYRDIHRTHHG